VAVLLLAACARPVAVGTAPQDAGPRNDGEPALEPYVDSIPGTGITFEMIPLPGGTVEVPGPDGPRSVEVGPVWIARTPLTWEAYDVFALELDRPEPGSAADAVAAGRDAGEEHEHRGDDCDDRRQAERHAQEVHQRRQQDGDQDSDHGLRTLLRG
jgi:hypothetical protein